MLSQRPSSSPFETLPSRHVYPHGKMRARRRECRTCLNGSVVQTMLCKLHIFGRVAPVYPDDLKRPLLLLNRLET